MGGTKWFYDEMRHMGVDYNNLAQAQDYDRRHQKLRDYQAMADGIVQALDLRAEQTAIDMGAGTGAFALSAARRCKHIYAVDVSPAMLACARQKAAAQGISNVRFCQGGFLTYEHKAAPADALVSVAVLHHLPDFWKLVALRRLAQMVKPGGRFYLMDVVFPGTFDDYEPRLNAWVEQIRGSVGEDFAAEAETHIRDEQSTYDWIMEGLLTRAGWRIDSAGYQGFLATYICTQTAGASKA